MQVTSFTRTLLLPIALAVTALPTVAQEPAAEPPGTPIGSSPGTIGIPVYENPPENYYIWFDGDYYSGSTFEVVDDMHLAQAGNIVSFTFTVRSLLTPATHADAIVTFYEDIGGSVPGPVLGSVVVPDLPTNQRWTQTIDLDTPIPAPQDIWMGVHFLVPPGVGEGAWTWDNGLYGGVGPTLGTTTPRIFYGAPFNYGTTGAYYNHAIVRVEEPPPPVEAIEFGTPPAATAKAGQPWPPFDVRLVDAQGALVEAATNPVTVSLAGGNGTLSGTLTRAPANGVVTFDDLSYDLAETIHLDVSADGLPTIEGVPVIVTPFVSNLRVTAQDLSFTPAAPQVGETTQLQALVRNAGQEPATAHVQFFRGNPDLGVLIGQQTAPVPVGGLVAFSRPWTPALADEGLQSIFVVVENLNPPEATPEDNRASRTISVGAAAEELQVIAGQEIAWPGAQRSVAVTINNIGAGPVTLAGASFGPPSWLTPATLIGGQTLQPGESLVALATLDVPLGATGAPLGGAPLSYPIPLEIHTSSSTFAGTFTAKLYDQAAGTVTVRVQDRATGAALVGALVAARDLPGQFTTNGLGEVALALSPGSRDLFAYKPGYIAAVSTVEVPDGASTAVLELDQGATLGVEQIVSEPLSTQEIFDRGVSVSDPVNNHIVDFVVGMEIGEPLILPNVEIPKVQPPPGTVVEFRGVAYVGGSGSSGGPGGSGLGGGGGVLVSAQFQYNDYGRTETWILIPGQISVLKEFFEVTTLVVNNAQAADPTDIQLQGVSASLTLPAGIGLPDLDGQPQSLAQALGTLDAGAATQATWVVRGDLPGRYWLTGDVAAQLVAFGAQPGTAISATALSDEFEVTLPRLRCEFQTPGAVQQGAPFTFGVVVTNEASATANLVRVTLRSEDLENCRLAASQPHAVLTYDGGGNIVSAEVTLGDLAAAQSALAQFTLISEVTGKVEQVTTVSGCGTNPSPAVTVAPDPPVINQDPASQFQCAGGPVDFWVDAVGAPPLTYQWSKDGVAISGATAFEYKIAAVTPDDAGSYSVVVTNPGGSTESLAATLTVGTAPVITVQPADGDAATGATVILEVSADGSPAPTYQWLKDGAPISSATGYVLVIEDAQPSDGGVYQVVVSNTCGTVTSGAANVSVNAPPVLSCNGPVALWSPNHDLVDVQSAFGVSDPDGDEVTLTIRIFSDESEIPETGDGTGKHAPDFKNELFDGRGLLLRSERRGKEDGRWYVAVITADDGNGGVTQGVCLLAACPHDQDQISLDAVMAQGAAAAATIQAAVDAGSSLPLSGMYEHGLAAPLGPIQ